MDMKFDKLVRQKFYRKSKLYHGTIASTARKIELEGILLKCGNSKADFNARGRLGGFYVTADHGQAVMRAKLKSNRCTRSSRGTKKTSKQKHGKKKYSPPKGPFSPAIVKYMIDRQELRREFKYKCFCLGQYEDWVHFVELSRHGVNDHDYDIVEGPFDSTAGKGKLRKPRGHQIGIFSQAAKEYFDDHCVSTPHQVPEASAEPLLTAMQSVSIS